MANKDIFAPPSPEELGVFAPPSADELRRSDETPSIGNTIKHYGEDYIIDQLPSLGAATGGIVGGAAGSVPGALAGAGAGGALGKATQNLYNSYMRPEKAPDNMTDVMVEPVKEGVKGAALEGAGLGIGKIAGKVLAPVTSRVSGYLRNKAAEKAVAATGLTGLEKSKLVSDAGDTLLDKNIVRFGSSQPTIADRAAQALEESGKNIGDKISALDESGVTVDRKNVMNYLRSKIASLTGDESQTATVNAMKSKLKDIGKQVEKRNEYVDLPLGKDNPDVTGLKLNYGKPLVQEVTLQPTTRINRGTFANESKFKDFQSMGDELSQRNARGVDADLEYANAKGYNPYSSKVSVPVSTVNKTGVIEHPEIGIAEAEKIRAGFDKGAKWDMSSPAPVRDANKAAAQSYRQANEGAAIAANPDLAAEIASDKRMYQTLKPIVKGAQRRAAVTSQSPPGGLLDASAMAAGGVLGHGGAVAAPFARRILAPRINSSIAVTANSLSQVLKSNPEAFGKFAGVLAQAASRGADSLMATDKILQETSPEYRQKLIQINSPSRSIAEGEE